jgi:hypothetical protein
MPVAQKKRWMPASSLYEEVEATRLGEEVRRCQQPDSSAGLMTVGGKSINQVVLAVITPWSSR